MVFLPMVKCKLQQQTTKGKMMQLLKTLALLWVWAMMILAGLDAGFLGLVAGVTAPIWLAMLYKGILAYFAKMNSIIRNANHV
jgi:hypothetical protein